MKVFLVSIPKSGTNMLDRLICTSSEMPGAAEVMSGLMTQKGHPHPEIIETISTSTLPFLRSHLIYHEEYELALRQHSYTIIFLYRDLRDCIVSSLYWDGRTSAIQLPATVTFAKEEESDLIFKQFGKWRDYYKQFVPWLHAPGVYSFRYEDFIQYTEREMKRLQGIVGGDLGKMMERFMKKKDSATFRKGIIGDWRNHFTGAHIRKFNNYFLETMKELGYEPV